MAAQSIDLQVRDPNLEVRRNSAIMHLLPPSLLSHLAASVEREIFEPGAEIVREGSDGDNLYVIATGQAEASTSSASGPQTVATLRPGEIFGELAVFDAARRRQATVIALKATVALVLDGETMRSALREHPETSTRLRELREEMLTVKFLKQSSVFGVLPPAGIKRLIAALQPRLVSAGTRIIAQGDSADTCYLIRDGTVQVVRTMDGASEIEVAVLEGGDLFGERALLSFEPRSASIYALTDCSLLTLHRPDLLRLLQEEERLPSEFIHLAQARECPRVRPGVEVHDVDYVGHAHGAVLINPATATHCKLSPDGYFLWQRMDGSRTLEDLVALSISHYPSLKPDMVACTVEELRRGGFLCDTVLRGDVAGLVGEEYTSTRRSYLTSLLRSLGHRRKSERPALGFELSPPPTGPPAGSLEESVRQYQGIRTQMGAMDIHSFITRP